MVSANRNTHFSTTLDKTPGVLGNPQPLSQHQEFGHIFTEASPKGGWVSRCRMHTGGVSKELGRKQELCYSTRIQNISSVPHAVVGD